MATFRHHAWIGKPADDVWKVVGDAGGISKWFGMIEESSLEGDTRVCTIGGGMKLEEQIITNDDDMRRLQYAISGGDMPLEHHLATVDVIDNNDGCLVVWGVDAKPDDVVPILDGAIAGAVQELKAYCEG